jgi:GGDEF domain-containing protein
MRENDWPVGASIGMVVSNGLGTTLDELLKLADELMYEVKKGGRNAALAIDLTKPETRKSSAAGDDET